MMPRKHLRPLASAFELIIIDFFLLRTISKCLSSYHKRPGPGCSELTTSLVNVSLNFQKLMSQICQYFLLKNVRSFCSAKASLIFSTKNFSVFGYKVVKHLTS